MGARPVPPVLPLGLRPEVCVFASLRSTFDPRRGRPLTAEFLAEAVERTGGGRTLQWVGGEPTIHIPAILDSMAGYAGSRRCLEVRLPRLAEAFALLEGVVDVYLADFKFGGRRLCPASRGSESYLKIVTRNLVTAAGQGDLIVQHLLLPGHFDCCFRPISGSE